MAFCLKNSVNNITTRGCFGLLVERSFWFLPRRPKSVYPLLSREEHSHAASHAHSPRPSSHVEAVGQHRGRIAAHTHCQAPRDVAAPLRLAPSRLQLPVRGPAPSNGVCRWSHAIAEKVRAGRRRAAIDADLLRLRLLHISFSVGDHLPGSSGLMTTIN